jgi:phage gp36-like protein
MAYVTNIDIEERLGSALYVQLTDDAGTGSADLDKVNEARLGAEGEVNSYLGRRVAVPVDVAGQAELAAVLKSVVLDLVEYRLHSRRAPIPDDTVRRHSEALRWLERVASGAVALPADASASLESSRRPLGERGGPDRALSRETLENL